MISDRTFYRLSDRVPGDNCVLQIGRQAVWGYILVISDRFLGIWGLQIGRQAVWGFQIGPWGHILVISDRVPGGIWALQIDRQTVWGFQIGPWGIKG